MKANCICLVFRVFFMLEGSISFTKLENSQYTLKTNRKQGRSKLKDSHLNFALVSLKFKKCFRLFLTVFNRLFVYFLQKIVRVFRARKNKSE